MEYITYIMRSICVITLDMISLAMLLRVILSWLPIDDNKLEIFLISITEPIILPVRLLFSRSDSMRMMPIDIPLLITAIIISILSSVI